MSVVSNVHIDIVFVMGLCGAGKTTLIQQLTGANIPASHGTSAGTTQPHMIAGNIPPDHTFVFIEIPGFDDSTQTDADILNQLWEWISTVKQLKNATFTGLLYVHDIRVERFMAHHLKNLELLKKMTGPGFEKNICIATTRWGSLHGGERQRAEKREKALEEKEWKDLLAGGAKLWRVTTKGLNDDGFTEMSEGERSKIQAEFWGKFKDRDLRNVMKMQKEMEDGTPLERTEAACALNIDPQALAHSKSKWFKSRWPQALLGLLTAAITVAAASVGIVV